MPGGPQVLVMAAQRTPIGAFRGALAACSATRLGSGAIAATLATAPGCAGSVDEVLMGCVLPAGLGQAPARQAALGAGVAGTAGATTLNKVCGSGMQAVILGQALLQSGAAEFVVAGGIESMSNAPYLLPEVRQGYRLGRRELLDHLAHDGLRDAYGGGVMGRLAERCAQQRGFSREVQDAYAASSVARARRAVADGAFRAEIAPLPEGGEEGAGPVAEDECPFRCEPEKIPCLPPIFQPEGGTVTAASSAGIADGAAALLLTRGELAALAGRPPLARIVASAHYAAAPADFPLAPIGAIRRLYRATGWRDREVDLYEINEAFAVVVLVALRELALDPSRVNVNGGACALGHPLGASGARILVSLIHALRARTLKRGIAALCIGGGEATAMALELC